MEKWTCPECGTSHQRDNNAAKNIVVEATKVLREAEEMEEKSLQNFADLPNGLSSVSFAHVNEQNNLSIAFYELIGNARNNLI